MKIADNPFYFGAEYGKLHKLPNNAHAIASYICERGEAMDVTIYKPDGTEVLAMFGLQILDCCDGEFEDELEAALEPMRKKHNREKWKKRSQK